MQTLQIATLVVCECGAHAHLTFSDGSHSEEFFSKEAGLLEIGEALDNGLLIGQEAEFLRRALESTHLPDAVYVEVSEVSISVYGSETCTTEGEEEETIH